jgi:methyl-accepting chemotaxis protein
MRWFNDLKLITKLFTGFFTVMALGVLIGGFSIMQLAGMNQATSLIANMWLPGVQTIGAIKADLAFVRMSVFRHLSVQTGDEMTAMESQKLDYIKGFKEHAEGYKKTIVSPEEKAMYDDFEKKWDTYIATTARVEKLSRADKTAAGKVADTEARDHGNRILNLPAVFQAA